MKAALTHACLVLLVSAGVAAAATLGGIDGPALAGGNGAISPCDPDGVSATYTTVAGNLTAVTVGAIADPACEGASVSVTVTDATGANLASGGPQTIPTDGGSIDNSIEIPVSPNPLAELPAGVEIVIAGA